MAVPTYIDCMLPFLALLKDGKEWPVRELNEVLAGHFALTPAERAEMLPSGQAGLFVNRAAWARTYLKKAAFIESPRRGVFKITPRGLDVLAEGVTLIDPKYLARFPEFQEFQRASQPQEDSTTTSPATSVTETEATPEEAIESAYQGLRQQLAQELLAKILTCSPTFFEYLVVELLVKMGYGGSRKDAGERIGQSGDGGIDGIIKEDRLGLDTIFIQAKRWQGSVGRPEIQKFVGALQGQRARKGVFITTSSYTADATAYAGQIDTKVVLIDGQKLASLMIDFDVGVSAAATYTVKRIDSDYFEEA
ncbi:restriction endonuclease [Hydrogenophaga sp.]|uniref:restriction endonuclease n=1 Tax=Hydrogenophaga sp. TaxID=1904254 RepID=UPI0027207C95|nr:restriction endonuclease [Hydrogenophaga sp.]MDO9507238.1 restriction endonuclease [Hydrogenophaga sp.]